MPLKILFSHALKTVENAMNLFLLRIKKLLFVLQHPKLRSALFRFHTLAGVEHKAVLDPSLRTIVDIGANRGQFALVSRFITNARVISFEPIVSVANIFEKIFFDDRMVKLYVSAIGPKEEKRLINLSKRDDSSSLLEIGNMQSSLFPGTESIGTQLINVAQLSNFISCADIIRPAMLKLDVQGFELEALRGCISLLDAFDFIYCECSFVELYSGQALADEVISYLEKFNFSLTGIYNPSYDTLGGCIQADFMFKKNGL